MSLRGKFVTYLIVVHLVFSATAIALFRENRIWLLAVEGFFLLSFLAGQARLP